MFAPFRWWSSKSRRTRTQAKRSRLAPRLPLSLECLEDRTLPAGHTLATATLLTFNGSARPQESVQAADFLALPSQQDFYRVSLSTGDRVTAVSAQNAGSALDSLLRVFDSAGHQIASNDNFNGRDPQLTFQAAAAGDYYVSVASANATVGTYGLTLSREPGA